MEFTFLGHSSFRIKTRLSAIVTDPFSPATLGLKFPSVTADIVTISHGHSDHNQANLVEGVPKVVEGPGEFELGGVSIVGVPAFHDNKKGQERGGNTIYIMEVERVRVCHLGDLGHKLTEEQLAQIGDVSVLLIPVGGVYTIDAKTAVEVVSQIEPLYVFPMHYQTQGLNPEFFAKLAPVEEFIAQLGIEPIKETRYSVTADNLPNDLQLVILERKG